MKRIIIKADQCEGCKNCAVACMNAHRTDGPANVYSLDLTAPAGESRNRILLGGEDKYTPVFCRHCDRPECVSSCMSGAMTKDPVSGLVEYDAERCGACFMCVMNCPYGVPRPDRVTGSKIIKCDFCKDDGGEPNCVKNCPTKAIYVEEV